MNRTVRVLFVMRAVMAAGVAAIVLYAGHPALHAQPPDAEPQEAPQSAVPTFRAAVDLLVVDASVVGRGGQPAEGLGPDDFVVEVDGRPRRVVSAELISSAATADVVPVDDEGVTSNAATSTGRLVIIVVDQATLPSSSRGFVEAARRWIEGLTPHDRVGLVSLPPPGPRVEPTTRHRRVIEAMGRVALDTSDSATPTLSGRAIGLWEAVQIADGNERALTEVTDRECPMGPDQWMCTQEVQTDAYTMDADMRSKSGPVLGNLRSLIEAMGALPGRKDLVLLSGGWVLPDRSSDGQLQDLAGAAAASRVTVHALVADTSGALASVTRTRPRAAFVARDRSLLSQAIESLAGMTGGVSLRPAGAATGAFERIGQAMSGYYRLGVEPEARDLDGRRHRLSVKVRPRGLSVSDHRRVLTAARPPVEGTLSMDDALDGLLRTPASFTDVGLRVTSQVVADPDSLPRVIFGVELSRASAGYAGAQILISDADGRIVATTTREVDIDAKGGAAFFAMMGVPPGRYDVRVAARDSEGRMGTVVHPLDTDAVGQGAWRTHGLSVFEFDEADPQPLRPLFGAIARDAVMVARVDLVPEGRASLGAAVPVTFEIAVDGAPEVLVREEAVAFGTMPGGPLMAESQVPAAELPPGIYTIRARVASGDTPLTFERRIRVADDVRRVTERVELELRDVGVSATAARPVASASAERVPMAPFSLDAFLSPALVDEITQRAQGFGDATSRASLVADVETGIAGLRAGRFEDASIALRSALRVAPGFQPALVLLGACYAAAGASPQAAAVWQTAVLAERQGPSAYRIAIDGWLRANRPASALPLARQAVERWPEDGGFRRQYARTLLVSGDGAAGVEQMLAITDLSAADEPLLAATLSQLYRATIRRRPLLDAVRDAEAMRTFAARYPADGPRAHLVALWMRGASAEP